MPRIARVTVPGVPHHVTQRGNRRQKAFFYNDSFLTRIERSIGQFLKPKNQDETPGKTNNRYGVPRFQEPGIFNIVHSKSLYFTFILSQNPLLQSIKTDGCQSFGKSVNTASTILLPLPFIGEFMSKKSMVLYWGSKRGQATFSIKVACPLLLYQPFKITRSGGTIPIGFDISILMTEEISMVSPDFPLEKHLSLKLKNGVLAKLDGKVHKLFS